MYVATVKFLFSFSLSDIGHGLRGRVLFIVIIIKLLKSMKFLSLLIILVLLSLLF